MGGLTLWTPPPRKFEGFSGWRSCHTTFVYRTPSQAVCDCFLSIFVHVGTVLKSPRREVVRSSAGASVVYPPFLGVVRVAYPNVWFLTSNPL